MSDRHDSQTGAFLATFLAGAALGAVVVALTTPKTGAQLREDLADLLDDLRKRAAGEDSQA